MDIGKSFGYVFDDDQWITKILIAAVILLLGILFSWMVFIPLIVAALLLGGYGVEITRRVIRGDTQVLPQWDNWGELLVDGLKAWIIEIIYALPIIVLGICLSIPLGILSEEAQEVSALLSLCLSGIYFLWGIVMGLLLPAAIAMFVAEEEVSAAFRFGDVFGLVRDNFVTYLLVLVIGWVASFIGGLGLLVCGVGVLVTAPYAGWITAHIRGQAYLEAKGQTAQPALEEEVA
jgi:hypothetical protein